MLQSKAGIANKDYLAQKALLKKVDSGSIEAADLLGRTRDWFQSELDALA